MDPSTKRQQIFSEFVCVCVCEQVTLSDTWGTCVHSQQTHVSTLDVFFYRCLWRLTLDSGSPGAVVENSQLSKHLSWPHGAELQALLRHLHLAV